jgi:hypothetical protein
MNIEKIEVLTKERQNIILQMKHEKINKNDKNILKSLKNKYHSISNKINYLQNHDRIKEHKKILNRLYETTETLENKRKYAKEYQQNIREIIKKYNVMIKNI